MFFNGKIYAAATLLGLAAVFWNLSLEEPRATATSDYVWNCEPQREVHWQLNYKNHGSLSVNSSHQELPLFLKFAAHLQVYCLQKTDEREVYRLKVNLNQWQDNLITGNARANVHEELSHVFVVKKSRSMELKSELNTSLVTKQIWLDLTEILVKCSNQAERCHFKGHRSTFDLHQSGQTNNFAYTVTEGSERNIETSRSKEQGLTKIQLTQENPAGRYQGLVEINFRQPSVETGNDHAMWWEKFQISKTISWDQQSKAIAAGNQPDKAQSYKNLWESDLPASQRHQQMRAWLINHQDSLDGLKQDLMAADKDRLYQWAKALQSIGSPTHQHLITELIDYYREEVPIARYLITSLGMVHKPAEASRDYLQSMIERLGTDEKGPHSKNLGRNAAYAYGIMAGKGDQANQQEALSYLFKELKSDDPSHLIVIIRAIGNSGATAAWPRLKPFIEHAQSRVREAAIFAGRFMDKAFPDLIQIIKTKSLSDKIVAAKAIRYQPLAPDAQKLIIKLLNQQLDSKIKYQLVAALAGSRTKLTRESKGYLMGMLSRDSDRKIKSLIEKMMSH